MKRTGILCLLAIAVLTMMVFGTTVLRTAVLHAQQNPAAAAARTWRDAHERAIVAEFVKLLSIPNLASDVPNIRRNAEMIATMLGQRGIGARLLEVAGAPPVVYGEIRTAGASRTVVFYAHYDGQPLDPKEWASPPWEPTIRDKSLDDGGKVVTMPEAGALDPEWRIYARSAGDDKAPVLALLTALDALKAARTPFHSNIKFVFEGEEEAGSPHLGQILAANRDLMSSDVWLICDGPVHQTRRPLLLFGARGIVTVTVTVYGPRRELHSGHYGNWAPNPAMMLARLLASMKDDDGRVTIDHFYDGVEPLTETERRAVADAPNADQDLMQELWLGRTENHGKPLVELLNLPSLNVRGMGSARVGSGASNVIPSTATAGIDMRLVKGIDHREAIRRLTDHIRRQGYFIIETGPDSATLMAHPRVARVVESEGGYNAVRTSMDLPVSQLVIRTIESALGPVITLPTSGGSVPLYMIEQVTHAPTISVPIANHDDNQHSFNENLRLKNLWDGIELMAALLTM